MKKYILSFAISLVATSAMAKDTYLCVTEDSTGFTKKNDQWVRMNFFPEKYILTVEGFNVTFKHFDSKSRADSCKPAFFSGGYSCRYNISENMGSPFQVTNVSEDFSKFTTASIYGYFQEGTDDLTVSFGKCTKL